MDDVGAVGRLNNGVNPDAVERFQYVGYEVDVALSVQDASMLGRNHIHIQLLYLPDCMPERLFAGHDALVKLDHVWERAIGLAIRAVVIIIAGIAFLFELNKEVPLRRKAAEEIAGKKGPRLFIIGDEAPLAVGIGGRHEAQESVVEGKFKMICLAMNSPNKKNTSFGVHFQS
jgi:hypothetical protein